MKDLLYKEFRLAIHPSMFIFMLFGVLLLIPSWPYFIAFGYIFIAFMNIYIMGRSNQDIFFTACLPVRKRDTVKARVYSSAAYELIQIVLAVPFAVINATLINPSGNAAGMNPNFAFFGCVFVMYGLFNVIMIPGFYKTAYKVGAPMILGTIGAVLFAGAVEAAVHLVPVLNTSINAIGTGHLGAQLIVLAGGILLFFGLTWLGYHRAALNFEKVDL
jgi:hypothetical protein